MTLDQATQNHRDRCGGLITCTHPFAAKKWPFQRFSDNPSRLDYQTGKCSAFGMMKHSFLLNRRALLAGLGTTLLGPSVAAAQPTATQRRSLVLRARPRSLAPRQGQAETGIWGLEPDGPGSGLSFARGEEIAVTFHNELPASVILRWRGIDGSPASEPLTARPPVAPGGSDTFSILFKHAGTSSCDIRLLGDRQARPSAATALVVREAEPVAVDRDQVVLIEDWQLDGEGNAIAPGTNAGTARPIYTVNGQTAPDIAIRQRERIRFRFINGCQCNVIAIKIDSTATWIMAIDGQPAEPFLPRNGRLVLAPGSRIDVFVDATEAAGSAFPIILHDGTTPQPIGRFVTSDEPPVRSAPLAPPDPLPSNGLPDQLDLKNALRTELVFDRVPSTPPGWIVPSAYAPNLEPAFRVQRNRTVVAALVNRATVPVTFHLHGHHFRLLDRLDDGWKPFWLDTLVVDAQQTQRIAFLAETPGSWLMQAKAMDWAAPTLIQIYEIT